MRKLVTYIISFATLLVSAVVIALFLGIFEKGNNAVTIMHILSDAFFIPGVIILGMGLIRVCADQGAFDMLGYGVRTAFSTLLRNPAKRKYKTYYDYKAAKEAQEKTSKWPYLLPGLVGLGLAILFLVLYYIL